MGTQKGGFEEIPEDGPFQVLGGCTAGRVQAGQIEIVRRVDGQYCARSGNEEACYIKTGTSTFVLDKTGPEYSYDEDGKNKTAIPHTKETYHCVLELFGDSIGQECTQVTTNEWLPGHVRTDVLHAVLVGHRMSR